MMKFYAIKNVEGKWLTFGEDAKIKWDIDCWAFKDRQMADYYAEENGGEIVPLVEKPAPVVVSEAEAEILEGAKKDKHPCMYIAWKVQVDDEDRLMRAYVNGWTVDKTKRYVLPMEGTELPDRTVAYAALDHTGVWTVKGYAEEQSAITFGSTVTQANIDSAPAWVKTITPVEVTDDEV